MNTPKIRFKGFADDWEQRKVSELFRVTRGYVLAATQTNTTKTDEKPYPVYSSQTKDKGLMGYYKDYLYEDAITWTTDGANAGTVNYRAGKFYCTNVCGVLLSNEVKANQMIAEALNNVAKGYVSYVGNPKLMNNVMADIVIQIPTQAEEREMLSSLFASLDHLITLHQRKCDETKQLKKFMLQKMFPKNGEKNPEIRFEGFTDDWEQRKLGEVCEIKDSARIPNSEWSESGVPYIRASDVTNENTDGVLFISQERYEFYKNRTGAPTKDDVLFNGGGEIGKSLLITDEKPIYVQGGAVLYAQTSKSRELVGQYLKTYFETTNAKSYIDAASAGGTMRHFTLKPSQIMRILMPSVEEQEKIGEYFANLDQLITLHQRKCDELKEFKKYMLQNMFPQKG